MTAEDVMETPVWRVAVETGRVTRLTRDGTAGNVRPVANGDVLLTMNSLRKPDDLHLLGRGGRLSQPTDVNRPLLDQLDDIRYSKWNFAGANGDTVWGYDLKPAGATGKLPVAFIVHGGP